MMNDDDEFFGEETKNMKELKAGTRCSRRYGQLSLIASAH